MKRGNKGQNPSDLLMYNDNTTKMFFAIKRGLIYA
jgi:hypothetical protein